MKLPKLYDLKRVLSGRLFFGKGVVIKLDERSELLKAFPKLTDFVFDRNNIDKFNDAHKLQLELKSICEDLLKLEEKKASVGQSGGPEVSKQAFRKSLSKKK
jgi:hypothetical protein